MQNGANIEAAQRPPEDWPQHIKVSIWLVKEDDHWSALASEFNVVGMGSSQKDAFENLRENLNAYLRSYAEEGAPFRDVRRRIPYRESLRLWFYALLTRIGRAVTPARQKRQIGYSGPRNVQHSREDLGPIPHHC